MKVSTIYSSQYNSTVNAFDKQRVPLNGKVGRVKDNMCVALQLAVYFRNQPNMYM